MDFEVSLSSGTIEFNLRVKRIEENRENEKFLVHPVSNPTRFLILQNNRPNLKNGNLLPGQSLSWEIVQGEIKDHRTYKQLVRKIEEVLQPDIAYNSIKAE